MIGLFEFLPPSSIAEIVSRGLFCTLILLGENLLRCNAIFLPNAEDERLRDKDERLRDKAEELRWLIYLHAFIDR